MNDFCCVSIDSLVYNKPCNKFCGSKFCSLKARKEAEKLLEEVKKQHPNFDPNWQGKSTFSQEFVLKLINYVRDPDKI